MATFEFSVTLDRPILDADYDRLFEAGLDDTTPGTEYGRGVLMVTREGLVLGEAIVSVVRDAAAAGFHVVSIDEQDLASLKTIANRLGRSYESLRLLARGERGPGGFPAPLSGDGYALYSWAATSDWFRRHMGTRIIVSADERLLAGADHLLRARALLSDSDLVLLSDLTQAFTGPVALDVD